MAIAVSGAALYALPVYIAFALRGKMRGAQLGATLALPVLLCLPAMIAGQSAADALVSLVRVIFGVPDFASGAPNLMNLFPRAAMEEMPEYFMLSKMSNVDPITNFSPYYTQESFATIMRGVALLVISMVSTVLTFLG